MASHVSRNCVCVYTCAFVCIRRDDYIRECMRTCKKMCAPAYDIACFQMYTCVRLLMSVVCEGMIIFANVRTCAKMCAVPRAGTCMIVCVRVRVYSNEYKARVCCFVYSNTHILDTHMLNTHILKHTHTHHTQKLGMGSWALKKTDQYIENLLIEAQTMLLECQV
jgi:hypothetical protein